MVEISNSISLQNVVSGVQDKVDLILCFRSDHQHIKPVPQVGCNSKSDVKCALCRTKTLYLLHQLFYELRLRLSSFMICTDNININNINLYFQKDVSFVFIYHNLRRLFRVAYA
jgi:hypothetical protein